MNKTAIEYLDYTWNPIAMRCTPISEGCANCWHIAMCKRHAANAMLSAEVRAAKAGSSPILLVDKLNRPLLLKKPVRIGVQFMGDLFHAAIPDYFIDDIFEVMAACPQHTFIILTKRPEEIDEKLYESSQGNPIRVLGSGDYLPNVWLGVSVEDQKTADERLPILLSIPAAKHIVSIEPMLGPVNIEPYFAEYVCDGEWPLHPLDWVIVGGETGYGARFMDPDWVRDVRGQCQVVKVPFFFKQWHRSGKEGKNRILDGRTWDEIPDMERE